MAYVGRIKVYGATGVENTFQFINMRFPGGWPEGTLQRVGEPITATGVDGTRARYTRKDYPTFVLRAISEAADFGAAVTATDSMRGSRIKLSELEITAAGVAYTWAQKAYIWSVAAKPIRADVTCTTGVLALPQGMVESEWTLQFVPGT
jgi:hypothetical protein